MKKYHRERCTSKIRATITDPLGRVITLFGKHAFEWGIAIEKDGRIIVRIFPDSKEAKKEFNRLVKRK